MEWRRGEYTSAGRPGCRSPLMPPTTRQSSGTAGGSGSQRRRHVEDRLADSHDLLGEEVPEARCSFDRPSPLRPPAGPSEKPWRGGPVRKEPDLREPAAVPIERDGGVAGLVRVDADRDHPAPPRAAMTAEHRGGRGVQGGRAVLHGDAAPQPRDAHAARGAGTRRPGRRPAGPDQRARRALGVADARRPGRPLVRPAAASPSPGSHPFRSRRRVPGAGR